MGIQIGDSGTSAMNKINYMLDGVYNVKAYGLVGDGVTDDSAAFNTLINTTAVLNSNIYFPIGIYIINNISTTKLLSYSGSGMGSVIKSTTNTTSLTLNTGSDKSSFENLKFLGTSAGTSQIGLYFNSSGRFRVSNCDFESFGGAGIRVADIENSNELGGIINSCKLVSNNIGIDCINRGEYVSVNNCSVLLNTTGIKTIAGNTLISNSIICYNTNGIELASGTNNGHGIISDCEINHNVTYSINIHDTTAGQSFIGNHIIAGTIRIANTTGIVISGGQINADAITIDTNVGLVFEDVRLPATLANTITLTGTPPEYKNCTDLNGNYAYDLDNFGATKLAYVNTTDATVTTIHTIPSNSSSTILVSGYVIARRTGGVAGSAEDGAAYRVEFCTKNVAGTATLIGSSIIVIGESQVGWDVTLVASGTNILIKVTGAANNNISWEWCAVEYRKISS